MAVTRVCLIVDCGKSVLARDLCRNHYATARRKGEFANKPVWKYRERGACRFGGCGRQGRLTKGYCQSHYKRLMRHGDPAAGATPMGALMDWIEANASHLGDDCLIWPFASTANGYGVVTFRGKRTRASRAMCTVAHGEPPTPQHDAAHSCGRGAAGCTHPGHLRWATKSENMAEKVKHLAGPRGATHPCAKLSASEVREIRRLVGSQKQSEIAAAYGVDQSHVSRIKNRDRAWAWLD